MQVIRFAPLIGSPGEMLWAEGEASYVLAGRAIRATVTRPPVDLVAWCAELEAGELGGIQACRLVTGEAGVAHGLLSWVRPAYRRRGVFAAIQAAVDAALLAEGIGFLRSWVVEGPEEAAMAAAIEARGGARVGEVVHAIAGRRVRYAEFLRPLLAA